MPLWKDFFDGGVPNQPQRKPSPDLQPIHGEPTGDSEISNGSPSRVMSFRSDIARNKRGTFSLQGAAESMVQRLFDSLIGIDIAEPCRSIVFTRQRTLRRFLLRPADHTTNLNPSRSTNQPDIRPGRWHPELDASASGVPLLRPDGPHWSRCNVQARTQALRDSHRTSQNLPATMNRCWTSTSSRNHTQNDFISSLD